MPRLCVVGSTNIDLTVRAPRFPRPGETVTATDLAVGFGGKGCNQAVMAARLGADVCFVSCVGADPFGTQALDNLRRHGVPTDRVRVHPDRPTGSAFILVDDQAQNRIVVAPGANAALAPADLLSAADAIATCDLLLCQLEVPLETVHEALRLAHAFGVRTLLNPAPAAPLPADLLALADLCVPNETELEALAGPALNELVAAERLRLRTGGTVLVTLGGRGALVVEDGLHHQIPTLAVRAVDPTAAGDAFIGALAVDLAAGRPLTAAAARACALAALTVTRPGAQSSFPTRAEAEAFLAQHEL